MDTLELPYYVGSGSSIKDIIQRGLQDVVHQLMVIDFKLKNLWHWF
jgi:hypothetical protein